MSTNEKEIKGNGDEKMPYGGFKKPKQPRGEPTKPLIDFSYLDAIDKATPGKRRFRGPGYEYPTHEKEGGGD